MIMPCEYCETEKPTVPQETIKDGLSERKLLFDQWDDTRVSRTPRTHRVENHNQEKSND